MAGLAVVDASVLIAHLDPADALHAHAGTLLANEVGDLAASVLTLAEVLVGPARHGRIADGQSAFTRLAVRPVDIAANASDRLAAIRVATGLRMPDCCVLLAAQDREAERVLTLDARLAREAARFGFSVPAA